MPPKFGTTPRRSDHWSSGIVKAGAVAVANNIAPPGRLMPVGSILQLARARIGTAPTGASLTVDIKNGATTLGTLTIAAAGVDSGWTSIAKAVAEGDVITFNVTQVGSTVAGSDLAIDLDCFV